MCTAKASAPRRMGSRHSPAMQTCRTLDARNAATDDGHNGDDTEPAPPAPIEREEVGLVLGSSAPFTDAPFAGLPAKFLNALRQTGIAGDLNG
jgi:hypothetical protein